MKYQFGYFYVVLFLVALLNSGCGGGGSDAPASGDSPPSLSPTALTFNAVTNGPIPAGQSILVSSYSGDQLTVSGVPSWLSLSNYSGSSTPFHIDVDVLSTNLSPGSYTATLRFYNEKTIPVSEILGYQDVSITYVVEETLSVDNSALIYNVVNGSTTPSESKTVNIYGGSLAWTATTSDSWLQLSKTSGTAPDSIDISIAAIGTSLTTGTHSGTVTLTSPTTNETLDIVVSLNVEPHRLHVPDKAVAFTKLPSRSYLSSMVSIRDNGSIPTNWIATDDAAWLTLGTSTGITNGDLLLSADPTGLADGLYYATVTISPDNEPTISNTEIIRVGLYVSSSDATASDSFSFVVDNDIKSAISTDPLRPYVYVTGGGTDIKIYNVYTKSLLNTISITSGQIHDLVTSSDGSTIYAANFTDLSIVAIDLDTQVVSQTFTDTYFSDCGNCNTYANSYKLGIKYAEPNGYPILITNSLDIINAATGAFIETIPGPTSTVPLEVAISPDSATIYSAAVSYSMNEFHRYNLEYSYITGVGLYYERTHLVEFLGNMSDLEVLLDEAHLCASISGSNNVTCFNSADLTAWQTLPIGGAPSDVEIGNTGNIYASYSTYPNLTLDDITSFDATGTSLSTTFDSGQYIDEGQLAVSGDGLRLISRGGDAASLTRTIYLYDVTP